MTSPDPLYGSRWRPLRLLMEAMDRDIAALYPAAGITGLRSRFVGPLIQLGAQPSMTIQELAHAVEVTHSAMSQTAAALRTAGFVEDAGISDTGVAEGGVAEGGVAEDGVAEDGGSAAGGAGAGVGPHGDRRTRRIRLSEKGRATLPFLRAEWRATEATLRDLEQEIAYPLTQVVADLNAALATRSFADRLAANLTRAQAGTLT